MKRQTDTIFILVVCFLLAFLVREQASVLHKAWEKRSQMLEEKQRLAPVHSSSVQLVDFLSTGMKPLIADVYWTKATTIKADEMFALQRDAASSGLPQLLAHASVPRTRRDDYELYELLRYVTYFDPSFEYAAFYGSHLLAFDGNIDLAISLLDDALKKNPKSGMIPSTLSFIYYFFLKDWNNGAFYAKISFQNGGKYSSQSMAVANLYAVGKNYDMAIDFLSSIYDSAKDPATKDQVKKQIDYVYVEKHIEFLQRAVNKYKNINGRYPPDLERLVLIHGISSMPKEPFGGKYVLGKDGKVTNQPANRFTHYQDMREYIPERGMRLQ